MSEADIEFLNRIASIILNGDQSKLEPEISLLLNRLVKTEVSKLAWLKLKKSKILDGSHYKNIFEVAEVIGLMSEEALVKVELTDIKAYQKATKLASKLIKFLESNNKLFSFLGDLTSEPVRSAKSQLYFSYELAQLNYPSELESFIKHMDEKYNLFRSIIDIQSVEPKTNLSISESLQIVLTSYIRNENLIQQLKKFEEFANFNAQIKTAIAQPNKKLARANEMAIDIMATFVSAYGSEHYAVTTSLLSQIFDAEFDEDLVKKWWLRRRLRDTF